jgi:hypothetical protein
LPGPATDGQAIFSGQHQIKYNQIRLFAPYPLNGLTAIGLNTDPETIALKIFPGQIRKSFIVLDDQDAPAFVCLFHAIYPALVKRFQETTEVIAPLAHDQA